jgi:acyl-CoA synthetase (AMP-forming)/AMP-acid ligase II
MRGTMMDYPLTLRTILERAGQMFPKVGLVSRKPDKSIARSTYGQFHTRARKLGAALTKLGMSKGDRVASMMWNHAGHLEAFFGVPCAGGILHPLNLRLHPHEIAAIARHAGDKFLLIDDVLLPAYEKFKDDCPVNQAIVVPFSGAPVPKGYLDYEQLLAEAPADMPYPALDENDGAVMSFTSGTTGNSKGVIYSHRSLVLHTFAAALDEVCGISYNGTVMPVVPMFHANAWGLPFACTMLGARFVLPGPNADAEGILNLMKDEEVTFSCGVPTVWMAILAELEKNPTRWRFDTPVTLGVGGSAPPLELIRRLDRFNLKIKHLWGMTESSPLGLACGLRPHMRAWPPEKQYEQRAKQGMPSPFVEMRLMGPDGEVPHDGISSGEIEMRGPWVAAHYYNAPEQDDRWTSDGWFKTGDVATMDEDGYVKIVDRAKDLVKSGGEWISSVDLENALMGHPAVREACVVGIPHPKWQERPLAAIVLKEGARATPDELGGFLANSFSKWQIPDAFVFVDAIPRTSVGKFKKASLRDQFADWKWDA